MQFPFNDADRPAGGGRNGSGKGRDVPAIRVAILESDELMRDGLVSLVASTEDLACVGAWTNVDEAQRGLAQAMPDVLLLDVRFPEGASFEVLKAIPVISPRTRVIAAVDCREDRCLVLNPQSPTHQTKHLRTVSQELAQPDDCLQLALKMGVHGALRRQRPFRELAQAIRTVHAGQYWIEAPTAARLAQQHLLSIRRTQSPVRTGTELLTLRERQVLTLIAEGRSNKEIARELQLGYSTVKNYVSSILEKLNLSDRTQLALFAINGIGTEQPAGV